MPEVGRGCPFSVPLSVCQPTFKVIKDDLVFAMDSCFAQDFEETLGAKEKRWHDKYNVF